MADQLQPTETAPRNEKLISAACFLLALLIGAWLRFRQIGIKPFHHDEGVNSFFLLNLWRKGEYQYNPENYHGPSLYYITASTLGLFGETDFALRFWPVVFGLLTILLLWLIRKELGTVGLPIAAFCVALSPGLVYFSRDFIHEMSFACCSLGIVIGLWRYADKKQFGYLALAAVSAGLLFATKETAIVTIIVMIIALLLAAAWDITRNLRRARRFELGTVASELRADLARVLPSLDYALAALIIFLFINVILYSSLFRHWAGVADAVKSVVMWSGRRNQEHVKPFGYYLGILLKLELPLLIGSLLAGVAVLWRGTRFWLFVAAWTAGITLAYSIIGYKTPWLALSFLVPMALLSGYAAERITRALPGLAPKLLWLTVVAVGLTYSTQMAWRVNFYKHDDNSNATAYFPKLGERLQLKPYLDGQYGYVYAQTDRGLLDLVRAVKQKTDRMSTGNQTGIYVASPNYWPLPWYFRNYTNVAFSGQLPPAAGGEPPKISQPLVIAEANQQTEMNAVPGFRTDGEQFVLRPGVNLMLYEKIEGQ